MSIYEFVLTSLSRRSVGSTSIYIIEQVCCILLVPVTKYTTLRRSSN